MREEARKVQVQCEVNGQAVALEAHPMARLLDVLRENLRLTGTKEGCGEGECGACSIEVNGELVNSCLVPLLHVDGAKIQRTEFAVDLGGAPLPRPPAARCRMLAFLIRHQHAGFRIIRGRHIMKSHVNIFALRPPVFD